MVQIAKHKYQKLIEVRQKSFIEKKELHRVIFLLSRKNSNYRKDTSWALLSRLLASKCKGKILLWAPKSIEVKRRKQPISQTKPIQKLNAYSRQGSTRSRKKEVMYKDSNSSLISAVRNWGSRVMWKY
jgi:hypothetical protein